MTIYVITKGEYDDYHIIGVTTNEKQANIVAEAMSDRYNTAKVEIFNTEGIDAIVEGERAWLCKFEKPTLKCVSVETCCNPEAIQEIKFYKDGITVIAFASSIAEAVYKSQIIIEAEQKATEKTND